MYTEKVQKTIAEFWNRHHKVEVSSDYWTSHPIINEYVNTMIAPGCGNILEWFAKNFVKGGSFNRGLSLGCGTGAADRQAIQAGICQFIDGMDISPASIETAKQEALKAGLGDKLRYSVEDLNSVGLQKEYYDFALCVGSLHHVENLEHLFNELRSGLQTGAFLFINEYVGPSRLQWTEKQLTILNKIWEILPPEYRKPGPLTSVNMEELIRVDPSEAVRSFEIIRLLYQYFEVIDHVEYGGGFLMPFWSQGIIPDIFLQSPHRDKQVIIKLLCFIDELMREEEILPNCYVQIVMRNNPPKSDVPSRSIQKVNDRRRWTDFWLDCSEATNPGLIKKAFWVLRNEGFIPLLRAIIRYLRKI